jgi:hypothetical protein
MTIGHVGHLSRKRIDSREILLLKARMLIENLLLGHTVGEPAENVIYCDPHSSDARLTVSLIRFDRDPPGEDVISRLWRKFMRAAFLPETPISRGENPKVASSNLAPATALRRAPALPPTPLCDGTPAENPFESLAGRLKRGYGPAMASRNSARFAREHEIMKL